MIPYRDENPTGRKPVIVIILMVMHLRSSVRASKRCLARD